MKNQVLENVLITDAGAEGKAIAKINEMVVFVQGAVPGDVAHLQVMKKKKSFMEAKAIEIVKPSELRDTPFCEHFGTCGGCKWQNLKYEHQIAFKQKQVKDAMERLAKVEIPEITPIVGSEKTKYYRNKLEYTFSNKRWFEKDEMDETGKYAGTDVNALGFHIPGRFDKILDIKNCYLQEEPSNSIRLFVRDFVLKHEMTFFDIREQHGFLRNMVIRSSSTGDLMVIMIFFHEDKKNRQLLMDAIYSKFPQITSLIYIINEKKNDSFSDLPFEVYCGKDHIMEEMEGLHFKIGPKSFYQTNSDQAYQLYKITRDFAGITKDDVVYDLYTGTGTIANFVARSAKKVVGIEYIDAAIEDAKENSRINGIGNTSFFAGDMKDVLNDEFIKTNGKPDVIITDPPRAGMHEDVVNKLMEIEARHVVYVSCNPATQARDLALMDSKYKVMKIQPVDMFPHTHHVENVVLLEKR